MINGLYMFHDVYFFVVLLENVVIVIAFSLISLATLRFSPYAFFSIIVVAMKLL